MLTTGWGRYPQHHSEHHHGADLAQLQTIITSHTHLIPRGAGLSYGDSALANHLINTQHFHHFIHFDDKTGILQVESGVTLDEILQTCVPKGWFLSVTPGTRYITIGGAIAADVHGKNHHHQGCFSNSVISMTVMQANGEVLQCSREHQSTLFYATCGGMGLTGLIVSARIRLIPITSTSIRQSIYPASNLTDMLALMDEHHDATYSVAWIDCLAEGKKMGRSLLILGEHAHDETLTMPHKRRRRVPCDLPSCLLNKLSIRSFNALYYHQMKKKPSRHVDLLSYFYPLDALQNWNRLYGKQGFLQYQFVIDKAAGKQGLERILQAIVGYGKGSFLAVLKRLGPENKNFLSFPKQGYTLALDFQYTPSLLPFLATLDELVLDYGGRIYLAKDARMSAKTMKASYPKLDQFLQFREHTQANARFHSHQSQRLNI